MNLSKKLPLRREIGEELPAYLLCSNSRIFNFYRLLLASLKLQAISNGGSTKNCPVLSELDDYRLPGNFDCRSHNPFCASEDAGNWPTPKHSSALAATKAYCDTRVQPSEPRGDGLLSLTLFYRKVKTLLRQFFSSLVKR
jgi:hypothetical protein